MSAYEALQLSAGIVFVLVGVITIMASRRRQAARAESGESSSESSALHAGLLGAGQIFFGLGLGALAFSSGESGSSAWDWISLALLVVSIVLFVLALVQRRKDRSSTAPA